MPLWILNILVMAMAGLITKKEKTFTTLGGIMLIISIAVTVGSKTSLIMAVVSWLVALFIGFVIYNAKPIIKEMKSGKDDLSSFSPEIQKLYSELKRNDNNFKDIVIDDLPVQYLFKHAMEQSQDVFVNSFKRFMAELDKSDSFKVNSEDLNNTIASIFESVSTSEDKLKQVDGTEGQAGAILQNSVLYAIACAYKNGEGILRFMHGDHTNTSMHDFIAPLGDEEYCLYMLKKHKSLAAITINLESKWYVMLVALGYLIMSNNDDEHHDIYSERMFSHYEK